MVGGWKNLRELVMYEFQVTPYFIFTVLLHIDQQTWYFIISWSSFTLFIGVVRALLVNSLMMKRPLTDEHIIYLRLIYHYALFAYLEIA